VSLLFPGSANSAVPAVPASPSAENMLDRETGAPSPVSSPTSGVVPILVVGRYARSSRHSECRLVDLGRVLPTNVAMRTPQLDDGHFSQCLGWRAGGPYRRRLSTSAIGELKISMGLIAIDVDAPQHVRTEEWDADIRQRVEELFERHPGLAYSTKGGLRLIWQLSKPFPIATPADATLWSAYYLAMLEWLRSKYGIIGDPSCKDFTRLFRLPRVRRDGVDVVPDFEIGDVGAIGFFDLGALTPSGSLHSPLAQGRPNTTASAGQDPRRENVSACWRGLLFALLEQRGLVLGEVEAGVYRIVCPRHAHHTTGAPGDGTLLYTGHGDGRISCLHRCSELSHSDWLRELGHVEERGETRELRILRSWINGSGQRARIRFEVETCDDGEPRTFYLGLSLSVEPRWRAFWASVGRDVPSNLDPLALGRACFELRGETFLGELGTEARENPVVRFVLP
jgi:hypothetical protein